MASLFEKKILLSIGFMGFWFCCMTLYFVTRISSQEHNANHSSSNSSRLRGGGGPLETSSKEILMMQHNPTRGYRPSSPKAQEVMVTFLSPQGGNKSIGGGVRPHSSLEDPDILDRTPFPQSIKNQKWERILHPAEIMRPQSDLANDKHSFSQKNNAAAADAAANDDVYAADDQRTHLLVPHFWKPSHLETDVRSLLGNYGERLITPYEASLIGSHTPSFTNYDVQVGDAEEELIYDNDDPEKKHRVSHISYVVDELPPEKVVMLETIYVSISSYRDYRCTHTVEMLFRQAKYPERIRVGIVDQLDPEEDESCIRTSHLKKDCEEDPEQIMCKYAHQMDVYEMDAQLAVGPVFARHIGHRMYRGEYFAMQADAHMEFVNDWDVDVIEQWRSAKNEMAVLTTYVSSVEKHYNAKTGERESNVRPYMCQTDFEEDYYNSELTFLMHGQQPEGEPSIVGEPLLIPFWAAGFSFARGHFVVQVPYDQYLPMVFQGEEISMGVRGFTHGYDFYAPEKSVLYHYYHTDPNKKKRKIKRFWEHADRYTGVEKVSKARLLGILQMFGSEVMIPTNTTQEKDEDQEKQQDAVGGGDASKKEQQLQHEKQQHEKEQQQEQKQQQEKEEEEEKEENEGDYEIKEISWIAIDEKLYGTGKVRTVQKFLDTFGIDLKKMKVQKHLCRFVDAPMTKIFTKAMRSDKMGIDYDKITYQFKDPEEYGKTWEQYM